MDATFRKRVALRAITAFLAAAVLALFPPVWYRTALTGVFYLDDAAQRIGQQFSDATRWIHAGGIAAVWLLNLVFFIVNEKKGDFGPRLSARTRMQNIINAFLIVVCAAAMSGYRYALSSGNWIGILLPNANDSVLKLWLPYYVFVVCGVLLWRICMDAVPATNCVVRWPLSRWIDHKIKRVYPTR